MRATSAAGAAGAERTRPPAPSSPSRTRLAGQLLVLVVLVSACLSDGEREARGPRSNLEEARDMLRERAARLAAGDAPGYVRSVAPKARPWEKRIAQGASAVPLADMTITFNPPPGVGADAPAFRELPVDFIYTYAGLPEENRFRFQLIYTIEERGRSWVVTRSRPASRSELPTWATGRVEVARSAHFLALFRPGLQNVGKVLSLAESARRRIDPKLTLELDPTHLILLARDHAQYVDFGGRPLALAHANMLFDGGLPRERQMVVNLAAVLGPRLLLEHPEQARLRSGEDRGPRGGAPEGTAPKPVPGPARGARGGPLPPRREPQEKLFPLQVFQHELAHLALARYMSPNTPGWVNEGAAMYLSGERRMESWKRALALNRLDDLSLVDFSYFRICPSYGYCNAAVLYLVEIFGPKRFWDFFRAHKYARPRVGSGSGIQRSPTEELLRRVYGFGLAELDRRTRGWIRTKVAAGSRPARP